MILRDISSTPDGIEMEQVMVYKFFLLDESRVCPVEALRLPTVTVDVDVLTEWLLTP